MLKNIKPDRKRSKAGSLTAEEKSYVITLFAKGYVVQDIAFIINQGRDKTVNQSVIQLCKNNKSIKLVSDGKLESYLQVQSSYNPVTLLNPYKNSRLIGAREAMLAAVQLFNSPTIHFKSEMFCVLANIAWTYLLHEKMERNKRGSSKLPTGNSVTVSGTLNKAVCPVKSEPVLENLTKIIEIRDAVEHTFLVGVDECFAPLFQACCINFDRYLTEWFGDHLSLARELSLALQFVRLSREQIAQIESSNFPKKIKAIQDEIENNEFSKSNAFQLSVHYTTEVSSKTNAELHKLVDYSENSTSREVVLKKQKMKMVSEKDIVNKIRQKGFPSFGSYEHQCFWKTKWPRARIRNLAAIKYGEVLYKSNWIWYEQTWFPEVLDYCRANKDKFK